MKVLVLLISMILIVATLVQEMKSSAKSWEVELERVSAENYYRNHKAYIKSLNL